MITLFAMVIILACYTIMAWWYAKEENMHIDMYVEIARINEQNREVAKARYYIETLKRKVNGNA